MPQKPLRHKPDANAVVYVRVPGWVKNACLDAATSAGMTVNAWAASVLIEASRITSHETTHDTTLHDTPHDTSHHTPHDTPHDTPTLVETLSSWITGSPLVAPCGKAWPCPASERTDEAAGLHYCSECGVRVTRPGSAVPDGPAPVRQAPPTVG